MSESPDLHDSIARLDDTLAIYAATRQAKIAAGNRTIIALISILRDCEEYFESCADVDDGIPNQAMRLLTEIRAILSPIS